MTDQQAGIGERSVSPVLAVGFLVIAVAVGVGAGALLAGSQGSTTSAGSSGSPATSDGTGLASGPPATPAATPTPTPTPTPSPEPTPVLVPAPLTGLPVTEAAAWLHPIAVMVDDHRDARPQSGFNAAAQVWQAPAEGGVPRYMLIFQDARPAAVGPIRSARQYFIDWASEWTAMYVHVGGSPEAMATLRSSGAGQLVYNADGFRFEGTDMWRIKERAAPHNVYTDADHLGSMAAKVGAAGGPVEPVWAFGDATRAVDRPSGTTIAIHYPYETITYRYQPTTNTYARFIDGAVTPQVDAADGRPVAPTNVVIIRMRFGALNDGHPEKKRLDAEDVGSGQAIISTNGRVYEGTWSKAAADAPTLLFGPDGLPITLTAGQTFVQVIALSYAYEVVEGTAPDAGIRER